jgi:CheY-like chemotaxis protein
MVTDQIKLRQCLLNLLSNANKFTEQGTVTLAVRRETREDADWMVFEVRDTGIGMTEAQLARLFQPFTQADNSISRKYGGTGLGLALTRQFCEMMRGRIRAESVVGVGSTFTMELPCSIPRAAGRALPVSPAAGLGVHPSPAPRSGCVLAIDDDPAVHRLLEHALRESGYEIAFARNGREGLELARKLRPAVITLDVIMPEMDGWMTLSLLKADPDLSHIPVIMLTMSPEQDFGFAVGVAEFLRKPIDRDRLLQTLRRYHRGSAGQPVLVVEDEPTMREMLRRMLEQAGWEVLECPNGAAALETLATQRPAVIVLDLMMPVMDGFQFLAELARHESWREIPVVVVSAKELTAEERQRLDGHVEQILQKGSFRRDDLLREVQDTVRRCIDAAADI